MSWDYKKLFFDEVRRNSIVSEEETKKVEDNAEGYHVGIDFGFKDVTRYVVMVKNDKGVTYVTKGE